MSSKHELSVKMTELGPLPESWEAVRLKDISLGFVSGGTPSTKNPAYWNGDIPWMTSAHINGRTVIQGVKCITEEGLKNSATNVIPKNNILIATRVGIGKVAVNLVDMTISQDLTGVVLDHKKVNVDFIYWLLSTYTTKLKSLAQGSTIKGLLRKEIENLKLPLPPLPEQRRIAEILATADTAIRKVDDAIAKTERLKRGLMQELLTKGVILGFMFDTNVFNNVLDDKIDIAKFPEKFNYFVTHVQHDELNRTRDMGRKNKLLQVFKLINKKEIPTEGCVLGISRFGKAKFGAGSLLSAIRKENIIDTRDALIGDTAIKNGLILVTGDRRLQNKVHEHGGWVTALKDFLDGMYREFKDSEVGRIPRGWGVARLGDVSLGFISGGTPSTKNTAYWNGDIPWMTSAHISGRTVTQGVKCITEEGLKNSATNVVPKNNVLIATRVGIGKVAVNLVDMAISQDLTGVVLDHKKVNVDFIYWLLSTYTTKLKSLAQGSTIKGLLRKEIENLKLPFPPLPEQHRIAEILSTVDKKLELETKRKEKLERIKKGLMNDLLTGKKRVTIAR